MNKIKRTKIKTKERGFQMFDIMNRGVAVNGARITIKCCDVESLKNIKGKIKNKIKEQEIKLEGEINHSDQITYHLFSFTISGKQEKINKLFEKLEKCFGSENTSKKSLVL